MFGVGLHFSLDDLLAVRANCPAGCAGPDCGSHRLRRDRCCSWGWNLVVGIVYGVALSTASTVVLLRALEQRGLLKSVNGSIAVGWLIVEDLAMVLVLVLLPPLAGWIGVDAGSLALPVQSNPRSLNNTSDYLWESIDLCCADVIVGKRVFPKLLWYVASTNSQELFTLSVIAVAIGIAYGSAMLFGVSFALGAFFAGMVMRESDLSHRAAQESLPLRDAFSVLFFVSVGMLFDPNVIYGSAASSAGNIRDHYRGKIIGGLFSRAHFPLSAEHSTHRISQSGPNWGIFVYPCGARRFPRALAGRGAKSYPRRRFHLYYA